MLIGLIATVLLAQTQAADAAQIKQWIASHVEDAGPIGEPQLLTGVEKVSINRRFYAVHFREWPVARMAPHPLTTRNVFAAGGGQITLFSKREDFEKAAPSLFRPVSRVEVASLLEAYLNVSKEFSQDGFFKFSIPRGRFSLTGNLVATGYATVDPKGGDTGELRAILTLVPSGSGFKLSKVVEKDTIKAGVRPICQATKLLDPDPIVRRMAERDLLIMGKKIRLYLLEQRSKAAPDLQQAIDAIWQRILKGER